MANKMVSIDLFEYLSGADTFGIVHSKFNKAINILLDGDILVTLLNETKDIAPMSLVCDQKTFNGLNIEVDDKVHIKNLNICFSNRILINIKEYTIWKMIDQSRLVKYSEKKHKNLVDNLYKRIIRKGKLEGIASVIYFLDKEKYNHESIEFLEIEKNHYVNFIVDRLERFIDNYKNCDLSDIEESFIKIIGFGPGLTPSVDDFICGLFSASKNLCEFYGISDAYIDKLSEILINIIHLRTTRVSEEMIRHCFKNKVSRTYDVLLTGLLYETKEDFEDSIDNVIEFGDTSGTDFLAGVYSACRLFEQYTIRRKFDGCKV